VNKIGLKVLNEIEVHVKQEFYPAAEQVSHFILQGLHIKLKESWYCPGEQTHDDPLKTVKWLGLQVKQLVELRLQDPQLIAQGVHTPPFSKYPSRHKHLLLSKYLIAISHPVQLVAVPRQVLQLGSQA
jgi:hypothetical protein